MKSFLFCISLALFYAYIAVAPTRARNLQLNKMAPKNRIDTSGVSNDEGISVSSSRNKRSADNCPVHPDTPVILNDKLTYFDFDEGEPRPEESEGKSSPAPFGTWWPGETDNLKASCPWNWVIVDYWDKVAPQVYPRYVEEAECMCNKCVNAQSMGCQKLMQPQQFYFKTGCQGNLPVFIGGPINISVGCICTKNKS